MTPLEGSDTVHAPVEYDPETDSYRIRHDEATGRSLSTTLCLAIETVARDRSETVGVLYDYVDPEALDALFAFDRKRGGNAISRLTFSMGEYRVAISGDGEITIRPPPDD